MSQDKRAKKLC